MNRTFLNLASAAFISLAASGCIIVGGGGGGQSSGNITLNWTFNGQPCALTSVQNVRVSIPGTVLENNGIYPCIAATNVAGVELRNFRGGRYNVTVEGLDSAGRVLFAATTTVVVNGNVTVPVNLTPTAGATGQVLASWSLPGNLACAQVGDVQSGRTVSRILISVDGSQPSTVDCSRGNVTAQTPAAMVTIENLTAGPHVFDVTGQDNTGFTFVHVANTVTVSAGGAVAAQFQLGWTVGSMPLKWTFLNNGATITCAQAQVSNLFINLKNPQTNQWIFADAQGNPTAGQQVPCLNTTTSLQGAVFSFLQAANYEVHIQAPVAGNVYTYRTTQTPPVLQVQAGVFAQSAAMGQTLVLQ